MARKQGFGLVIGDKMWPVAPTEQEHSHNVAARLALASAGRAWGVVWAFPRAIAEPVEIGTCGARTRAGFFLAEHRPGDPVVGKYEPDA